MREAAAASSSDEKTDMEKETAAINDVAELPDDKDEEKEEKDTAMDMTTTAIKAPTDKRPAATAKIQDSECARE